MSARYSAGEILLAEMLFSSQAAVKRRPVLVVDDGGDDDLLVTPVTSHVGRSARDVFLNDWQRAGLRLPSVVRVDKLATIEKGIVVRPLGKLTAADRNQVKAVLQQFLQTVLANW